MWMAPTSLIERIFGSWHLSGSTAPCGACRQVLNEFGPDAQVFSACDGPERIEATVKELLPQAFGPHNVNS